MTLRDRTAAVLKLLVDEYVSSGVPVASEAIARRSLIRVSPATVRNEMAELEGQGYIVRPHVSAGGAPSDKGYRFYVESITEEWEPPENLQRQLRAQFDQVAWDVEAWNQRAAAVLARMADNMAIVTTPRAPDSRFKYLQLVLLQEFLVLLVVVLREGRLRQHLMPLIETMTQQQLTEIANRLNEGYAGLTRPELEAKELPLSAMEEAVITDTITVLREVEDETATDHFVDGLRLLFSKPEFAEGNKARIVMEVLEEPALLRSLLSKAPEKDGPGVFIGEENEEEALRPFGVILCNYGVPNQAFGTLGVVGPTRMEYPTVIGGVKFLSGFLSDMLAGIHNPPA